METIYTTAMRLFDTYKFNNNYNDNVVMIKTTNICN